MKIQIRNERLWEHQQNGDNIDLWLRENVGYSGWKEWVGITALPYRTFEIFDEQKAMLFSLRWL